MQKYFLFLIIHFFINAQAEVTTVNRANELVLVGGADYHFGDVEVGASQVEIFTLINTGSKALEFYEIFFDYTKGQMIFLGKDEFPGDGGTCKAVLKPNESCTFVIQFKPNAVANVQADLKIKYYYGNLLQRVELSMTGVGVVTPPAVPALLVISDGPSYDFGSVVVGSGTAHSLTITNTGGTSAEAISDDGLNTPFSFFGGAYPGTGGTCMASLPPGSSCEVRVAFVPNDVGVFSETLGIIYNDGVGSALATRDLQGVGVLK